MVKMIDDRAMYISYKQHIQYFLIKTPKDNNYFKSELYNKGPKNELKQKGKNHSKSLVIMV